LSASLTLSSPSSLCFFNDTATTEIYTLSLHDALPIFTRLRCSTRWSIVTGRPWLDHFAVPPAGERGRVLVLVGEERLDAVHRRLDRKSTRLNSSHVKISYAVFCLKKKKKT